MKPTNQEKVTQHIDTLPVEIQPAVTYLRQLMLSIDSQIAEHIKWNSPAFYFSGHIANANPKEYKSDILVMNLRKNNIMCVLPTGQRIVNNTEILEGSYTDGRRLITFKNLEDIKDKEEKLKETIKEWLSLIEK